MTDQRHPFSVRLGEARVRLEFGSLLSGESRGEFIREAVRERADRLLEEKQRSPRKSDR